MLMLMNNEWKSTVDLGYASAFTEKQVLQPLHYFSGIIVHLLSRTLVCCLSSTHVPVGEASPHLSGADIILVAGAGWFCAYPSPAFAVVLPHSQLIQQWPVSPEGLLPALPFPSTCWSLFSHMGCAGRNSQAACKACASTRTLQGSWNECLEAGDGSQCHHLGHPTVATAKECCPYSSPKSYPAP